MNWPFGKKQKTADTKSKVWKICQPQPSTPKTLTAYDIAAWDYGPNTGMNLHYTGEIGDDDFPGICMEILLKLLGTYQTFLCTYEGMTHGYRFPDGWESREKERFPEACRRYAAEQNQPIDLLTDGTDAGIFSAKGLNKAFLAAWFSNPWKELRTSSFDIYSYERDQPVETDFHVQKAKLDHKTCDIFVMYTELPNELEMAFNKDFPPLLEVLEQVQAVCESCGKAVSVVWHTENTQNQ